LRERMARLGTALALALTFGVMGATGVALAGHDTSTTPVPLADPRTTPAVTPTLTVPVPFSKAVAQAVLSRSRLQPHS
jgi:hypothetical protein